MIDLLATALIASSLVLAGWAVLTALRGRAVDDWQLLALAAVELLLLVQVVVAAVRLVGGERPEALGVFVGYLVIALLVLPVGTVLALAERGRWSGGVLAVAGCTLAVVVVRLQQLWHGTVV